jgi:RNA recognition motif-containing protein
MYLSPAMFQMQSSGKLVNSLKKINSERNKKEEKEEKVCSLIKLDEYLENRRKSQAMNLQKQKEPARFETKDKDLALPNNTLFVEDLTTDITENLLKTIFGKYNGFKEVRLFSGKGMAFVEYDTELNAGSALLGLNNMNLTEDCVLHISFAKK